MAKKHQDQQYKEKFRPDDSALAKQVDAALEGVSMDALYDFDKPQSAVDTTTGMRRGRIVSVGKDDVFVDFGGKSQGIVSLLQFEEEPPKVGEEREFNVERYDKTEGLLILSLKGATANNVSWENLNIGQIVEGTVTGSNKGGLEMDIKGMRAFMPAGQVDIYFQKDLESLIGQKFQVEVTQFEREARNLIVSRRNILEREKEVAKKKMLEEVAEGQIRRGTVRSIMDFGAFVDLGGLDGLLHVSEMSHRRGVKPSEVVKVGDVLDVKILKLDREAGKLSLSLKQARGIDPWADAQSKYAVGTVITGRITKLETFGAFVEVEEGVEGLLPISEISYKRIAHPSEVVKVGDTVKLTVLKVDELARRMSFSLKQAGPDPWSTAMDRYHVGETVAGKVSRVSDFGAFVELEPGLEGLIHVSELSNTRVRTPADVVKPGQEVRVRILQVDNEARRIGLSLKQADVVVAESATPTPAAPAVKKKRPQLRGGLDF
jgi:small subunit ribosomal protein S1